MALRASSRRTFLAGSLILISAPALAVDQDSMDQEWGVFTRLAKLFEDLRAATDPIADGITKLKFVKFLNGINGPLTDILRDKRMVESVLSIGTCAGDAVTMQSLASRAADAIVPLVSTLEEKVRTLSTAIKPAGSRQAAMTLANQLGGLGGRKMWIHRTKAFCSGSPAQRAAFLKEVRGSISIVENAQKTLDTLIEQMSV